MVEQQDRPPPRPWGSPYNSFTFQPAQVLHILETPAPVSPRSVRSRSRTAGADALARSVQRVLLMKLMSRMLLGLGYVRLRDYGYTLGQEGRIVELPRAAEIPAPAEAVAGSTGESLQAQPEAFAEPAASASEAGVRTDEEDEWEWRAVLARARERAAREIAARESREGPDDEDGHGHSAAGAAQSDPAGSRVAPSSAPSPAAPQTQAAREAASTVPDSPRGRPAVPIAIRSAVT